MRVLLTGATGFLGQHTAAHLVAAGHDVSVLIREVYGMGHSYPPRLAAVRSQIRPVYADLRNSTLTARAVQEAAPDCIIHLAAAGVTNPYLAVQSALQHNLQGTLNLLQAAFEDNASTQQLIVARTPGETDPSNVYQASKAAAWDFCTMYARSMDWPVAGATIFQAYGPGQPEETLVPAAFNAALDGEDFAMTAGTQERDWIYVKDVVRGLEAAVGRDLEPGTTFDLGTGRGVSVKAVVEQIYSLVGLGGRPRPGALPERPGESQRVVADAARSRALLNWHASVPLEEGLRHFYNDKQSAGQP